LPLTQLCDCGTDVLRASPALLAYRHGGRGRERRSDEAARRLEHDLALDASLVEPHPLHHRPGGLDGLRRVTPELQNRRHGLAHRLRAGRLVEAAEDLDGEVGLRLLLGEEVSLRRLGGALLPIRLLDADSKMERFRFDTRSMIPARGPFTTAATAP
jgi:hypothetical protein